MSVTPSAYVPTGASLEMLATALQHYTADAEVMKRLDTATVDQLAQEWAAAAQKTKKSDSFGQDAIDMTEAAHLLILAVLRDTTIVTTASIARATGIIPPNKANTEPDKTEPKTSHDIKQQHAEEASEEADPEADTDSVKAQIIGASVRSMMAEGYNLSQFISDYTVHGDELRLTEEQWRQLTHEYGENCTAVMMWYGAKYYEVHWQGPVLPVDVSVTEKHTVQ